MVTFADELVHHATPKIALAEVSPEQIEAYRKSIHKGPKDNPTNDDVDQDLKLWSLVREGKEKNRGDLLAAGVKKAHVNALIAASPDRPHVVTISGAAISEMVLPEQIEAYRKSIHKGPTDNPTNEDVDQDLKLWSLVREGKKKNRRDLLAAGIKGTHVNALMAEAARPHFVKNPESSELVGPGQPALSRTISKRLLSPQVSPAEVEAYRKSIHKGPTDNPTNEDVDQDLKLWSLVREGKKNNRGDLLAAGIKKAHVNALFAAAVNRPHVVDISNSGNSVPKVLAKPRSFFRSWVRAIKGRHPQRLG